MYYRSYSIRLLYTLLVQPSSRKPRSLAKYWSANEERKLGYHCHISTEKKPPQILSSETTSLSVDGRLLRPARPLFAITLYRLVYNPLSKRSGTKIYDVVCVVKVISRRACYALFSTT